jgi:hypothetical protein
VTIFVSAGTAQLLSTFCLALQTGTLFANRFSTALRTRFAADRRFVLIVTDNFIFFFFNFDDVVIWQHNFAVSNFFLPAFHAKIHKLISNRLRHDGGVEATVDPESVKHVDLKLILHVLDGSARAVGIDDELEF